MVNENKIPLENKKPYETVQELKSSYETPSFEEFMKNYEKDENLNYDDLNGGGVGEVKGHGPCYVCEENKPYVGKDLYIACPGGDEENNRQCSNTGICNWYHATDSGEVEISNRAHIRCKSCYTDRHMSGGVFSCSSHWGNYGGTRRATFRNSLKIAMQLGDYDEFVNDVIAYMTSHYRDSDVRSGGK